MRTPVLPHASDSSAASEALASGMPATLHQCAAHARAILRHAQIDGYDVEARLLCEWAAARPYLDFVTQPDAVMTATQVQVLLEALAKRLAGMPVHRIIGSRDFYGLNFKLSGATLEPRPDTETLVDQVLDLVAKSGRTNHPLRILDMGTGTGAIALALLSELPLAKAVGLDLAEEALKTALQNAQSNGLAGRFSVLQSNWFEKVDGVFEIIVSNPPYIRSAIIADLDVEVREHDPVLALDGGADGLVPYREIARHAAQYLTPKGMVFLEIGFDQAADIDKIFQTEGYRLIELRQDLGGRDRAMAFHI